MFHEANAPELGAWKHLGSICLSCVVASQLHPVQTTKWSLEGREFVMEKTVNEFTQKADYRLQDDNSTIDA